ncbi:MAG: ABC transporter permease [Thermoplasmatota archaeon]
MKPRIIATDFTATMKSFFRNKGTLFFSFAFPVILILLFGAIFSGGGTGSYDLYVANYDYANGELNETMMQFCPIPVPENESNIYEGLYLQLENTEVIDVNMVNVSKYSRSELRGHVEDEKLKSVMVIPEGFCMSLAWAMQTSNPNATKNMTLMLDQGEQQRNGVIMSVVQQFIGQANLGISGGGSYLRFNTTSVVQEDFEYIDFFLPGVIALTVMTNSIFGIVETNIRLRKRGILRKLSTTPFTRSEWLLSKMLYMLFIAFLSTGVITVVGALVWGISFKLSPYMFILIISGSFAFAGIGMILSRFVHDEETAPAAANAVTFPMMFLAGIFFPLEQMPQFLQTIAYYLPLYYLGEGLRDAMIYGNAQSALFNTEVIFVFAAIVFAIGVAITTWKEE